MPSIREVVEIVASALGSDASPQHVEQIAETILRGLANSNDSPAYPPTEVPGNRAIITAFGHDKPGILAAVTKVVSDSGCNILDVSQKILQEYFTLIMFADVGDSDDAIQRLQSKLREVEQALHVRATVQHEGLFNAMHRP